MRKYLFLTLSLMGLSFDLFAQIYRVQDNLLDIQAAQVSNKSPEEVLNESKQYYKSFLALDVNNEIYNPYFKNDFGKPTTISLKQATVAWSASEVNPVVSLYSYEKYDPKDEGIGFCFGRAMFIDLYLSINNLNRGSIKKAFVVGAMDNGKGGAWGWHVSTIAQSIGKNGKEIWLAIDPISENVMDVWDWYMEMRQSSTDGKLKLYITESGKFGSTYSRYDETHLVDPYYKNYFIDMMNWFKKNNVSRDLGLKRK